MRAVCWPHSRRRRILRLAALGLPPKAGVRASSPCVLQRAARAPRGAGVDRVVDLTNLHYAAPEIAARPRDGSQNTL